ncbi:MAG: WD40 repeat domain-containing protein, partial [Gemmataceae bacterium]
REGNLTPAQQLLDKAPAEPRSWEWDYIRRLASSLRHTKPSNFPAYATAFNPNDSQVLTALGNGTLEIRSIDTLERRASLPVVPNGILTDVGITPNSQFIITAGASVPRLDIDVVGPRQPVGIAQWWDAKTHQLLGTWPWPADAGTIVAAEVAPDGASVALGGSDGILRLGRFAPNAPLHATPCAVGIIQTIQFSSDGQFVAIGGARGVVQVFRTSADTRQPLKLHWQRTYEGGAIHALAFAPDHRLAVVGLSGAVQLLDVERNRVLRTFPGHSNEILAVLFSHDNRTLYTGSRDRTVKAWDAHTGQWLFTLRGPTDAIRHMALTQDDNTLAVASYDGATGIWNLANHPDPRPIPLDDTLNSFHISPDGQTLAAAGAHGATLLNLSTGAIRRLPM